MNPWIAFPARLDAWAGQHLSALTDLFLLGLRIHVAHAFFASGLTKFADLESTVALFENEYRVPVLSPMLAAYAGTAAELALPVLIVLGLFTRPAALALFVFNIVAAVSYPDISPAGVKDHWVWGTMIATLLFFGAGRWSLDRGLGRRGAAVRDPA
ncbi:MAG: DoxX family protein [Betaproteobacteria bacterium]|nr:DoxX family protein [Betaproteobacteria bacterium]